MRGLNILFVKRKKASSTHRNFAPGIYKEVWLHNIFGSAPAATRADCKSAVFLTT